MFRNFKGDILASKTMIHENIPSVFVAEAIACVQAVIAGRDLGIMHAEIEGDSLMVIKKAQNTERDKSAIGLYIHDVKNLSEGFNGCKFQYAGRLANEFAHCLATEGLKVGRNAHLVNEVFGQEITELEIDRGWR
ncbi:hypothetical protein Gohar_014086 [Gossypium harknessii]|uniref:RNase H type-1 domain-containing protein n=1 Tax=Gossypium harknessii TaxID=34285 RepID=A0A7J9H252_9ROSI|nr:hypothetical protein [Gossypium harknessii]